MAFLTNAAFNGNSFSTSAPVRRDLHPAVTALEQHGRVVIVGGPKSGKTFLAHALLHHFHPRFTTHIICSTRKLSKHLNEQRPRILLMDGTLGEVGVDMEEYKVWRALLPRLMTCTDVRHCLVVVTCYPHLLLELQALEEGSHSFLLQDTCTVSLKEMAGDERKEMLQHFLSDLTMTQQEKHALVERVLKDDISGATFPWCCARLVQKLHNPSLDDPSDVFTCPAESYFTLLHRMLMDPTLGETVAALLCLTMMGLSDFYDNQINAQLTLNELGFRILSADSLEKTASFLKNFILSEDYRTFYSRVLYDAAGLALGRSHRLPVLLKVCDMDFLIRYVRVFTEPSNLFLTITVNSKNNVHLMERILTDITKGKLFEISQYLSLQSELFLEALEKYNRTRNNGEIQLEQAVDSVHGLSLLYWSVWTGCDWLIDLCVDISIKDGKIPPGLLQSVFLWALAHRNKCPEDPKCKITCTFDNLKSNDFLDVSSTTLPVPVKTLRLPARSEAVYSLVTSCTELTYLGDPSLPIPPSTLLIDRKDDACRLEFGNKQVYLALRLLTDTQVSQIDSEGNTLLHVAAEAGEKDVVEVVVRSGASLTVRNNNNLTPYQVAQGRNRGKTVMGIGNDRKTIHKACEDGDIVTVKVLLCCGVSVDARDSDDRTTLLAACQGGHTDLVSLLLELGAYRIIDYNAIQLACENGLQDIVILFIKYGVDRYRDPPLHLACSEGNTQCVSVLLDCGADINCTTCIVRSPLHMACLHGKTDIAGLLLDRGADINALEYYGETPFMFAVRSHSAETVALLLQHGADPNIMSTYCDTPLHLACYDGNTEIVSLLLEHGADINAKDHSGNTPADIAQMRGYTKTARLLLQWANLGDVSPRINT